MNRIEKLINEFCPDGVEYVKIKDYFTRLKGTPITAAKMKEIATYDGEIKVFAGGKTVINAYEKDIPKANITRVPAVLVQSRGVIDVVYYDNPFTFKNEMWAYTHNEQITVKYLYHFLSTQVNKMRESASGMGSLPQISLKVTEEMQIPLPPLSIQTEIVHILDSFTLLTAELTAELTARQKQYAFYRDYLLDFSDEDVTKKIPDIDCSEVKTLRLDEVAQIYDGTHQTPNYKDSGIPFISVENIKDIYGSKKYISEEDFNKYKIKPQINDVFMTRIGSIGDCAIFDKQADLAYYVSLALIRPNTDIVISKYLKYVIESRFGRKELRKRTLVNAVPIKINKNDIGKIELPIPPLSVQENIVKILDRFDKLNNDMSEGLPAEIEARQKQYEYYRDTLLSFDDKACSQIVKVERES